MNLFGREKIVTNYSEITPENVRLFLAEVLPHHIKNAAEMRYLFDYYRGKQPVLERSKEIRPDIVDNTVLNRAVEIVNFKVSYLLSEPIMYVGRHGGDAETANINQLNDWMYAANKTVHDKDLADDFSICGIGMRMAYFAPKGSEVPFEDWVLNPMLSFVAYQNTAAKNSKKVAGVSFVKDKNGAYTYDVYTDKLHMIVGPSNIMSEARVRVEANRIGKIPIIEYINSQFRLGAFEPVLTLMDSANTLASSRVEGTEQSVQNLTWFNDIELADETKADLKKKSSAFIFTKSIPGSTTPDIRVVATDLKQADQQVLADDLYKNILRIAGVPMTSDEDTSDSSNNGATIVRNGWQHAEARAKDTATLWEQSDKEYLDVILSICDIENRMTGLTPKDIDVKFTRRNYENISTKATVLTQLLASDKVDPRIAYMVSDITPDTEEAYRQGLVWYEKMREQQRQDAEAEAKRNAVSQQGSNPSSDRKEAE